LISDSATSTPPFQPLRNQRNVCHTLVNRFTRQTLPTGNISLWISLTWSHKNRAIERCSSVIHSSNTVNILTTEHGHARLILSLYCYLVIHIENVLLPFVTYLLTLPLSISANTTLYNYETYFQKFMQSFIFEERPLMTGMSLPRKWEFCFYCVGVTYFWRVLGCGKQKVENRRFNGLTAFRWRL
jgi:hypothetical protein